MESRIESGLKMHSRLRSIGEPIDERLMENNNGVTIINLKDSDLIATNHLIHEICKNVLQKESQNNSNNNINIDNNVEESGTDSQSSQELLFPMSDHSISEETTDCTNPLIIIYDGFGAFDLMTFSDRLSDLNHLLKEINICEAFDESSLLIALNNDLRIELALNQRLQLIVIYANSSYIYPEIVDKINELLFSLVISVRIILIVDQINKIQKKCYLNRSSFQMISCKSIGFKQIEITYEAKNVVIRRDV